MSKIKKTKSIVFSFSLLISILFVAGIPGIVLTAGKIPFLMAICIAFVGLGFYGMPILWTYYGTLCSLERLIFAIEREYIYTVKDLALYLNRSEQTVKSEINKCIQKRYLEGYLFDGQMLILNENEQARKTVKTVVCSGCGATVNISAGSNRCEYCGKPIPMNK